MSFPLISGLGLLAKDKSFEINIITPASLPEGPVTEDGGQKALKPSILVVSAIECEVSVSVIAATDTNSFSKSILIWSKTQHGSQ